MKTDRKTEMNLLNLRLGTVFLCAALLWTHLKKMNKAALM